MPLEGGIERKTREEFFQLVSDTSVLVLTAIRQRSRIRPESNDAYRIINQLRIDLKQKKVSAPSYADAFEQLIDGEEKATVLRGLLEKEQLKRITKLFEEVEEKEARELLIDFFLTLLYRDAFALRIRRLPVAQTYTALMSVFAGSEPTGLPSKKHIENISTNEVIGAVLLGKLKLPTIKKESDRWWMMQQS